MHVDVHDRTRDELADGEPRLPVAHKVVEELAYLNARIDLAADRDEEPDVGDRLDEAAYLLVFARSVIEVISLSTTVVESEGETREGRVEMTALLPLDLSETT